MDSIEINEKAKKIFKRHGISAMYLFMSDTYGIEKGRKVAKKIEEELKKELK